MSHEISFASREDGDGILKIMESDVAKGDIKLLYTRRPNPYDSFMKESDRTVIGLFKEEGEIVGMVAGMPRPMYINGGQQTVCYVTNMKRLAGYGKNLNWFTAFDKMFDPLDSRVYFCSVVNENLDTLSMLRKKRKKLPYVLDMDDYRTYIVSPTAPVKNPLPKLTFKRATSEDGETVIKFMKDWGKGRNFFPVFDSLDGNNMPSVTDFYMLCEGDEIKALGALWDKSDSKQYVIESYSGKIAALRILNPVISVLGYVRIPKTPTNAVFTFLSFLMAEDDNKDYYKAFLHHIRSEVKKTHDMFVIGTNESNPKRAVLDDIRSLKFDTKLCEVVMSTFRGMDPMEFDYKNIEIDCALL